MGSYLKLVISTNYKNGLIFTISKLQTSALLLIINVCKSKKRAAEFACTFRDATYVCKGWNTNKGVFSNILLQRYDLKLLIVNPYNSRF